MEGGKETDFQIFGYYPIVEIGSCLLQVVAESQEKLHWEEKKNSKRERQSGGGREKVDASG